MKPKENKCQMKYQKRRWQTRRSCLIWTGRITNQRASILGTYPNINQEQEKHLDGTSEENLIMTNERSKERGGDEDLEFALPDPYLSDEIPVNVDNSSHQLLETQVAEDSLLIEGDLPVKLHSKIKVTND